MNALTRGSLYMLAASGVCLFLAALESLTGIVSWMAPTEAHAFGWLAIGVVCTTIARSYMRQAIRLPNVRGWAMPQQKQAYGKRTRRYI